VSVFGSDAEEYNFDRDASIVGRMLTFNGNQNDIAIAIDAGDHNSPPRRCPGYGYALDIIEFLVDRYAPNDNNISLSNYISPERLREIKGKETSFMKIALTVGSKIYVVNNRYFPQASEVKHPLDVKEKPLNFSEISACGRVRHLPQYGALGKEG
jgi:hypothetical protein